jgi:hypothetical protein
MEGRSLVKIIPSQVEPCGECLIWKNGKDPDGYGVTSVKNKTRRVHKLVYEIYHGKVREGMCVCHTCDTPSCVNIKHLYQGTHKENVADRETRNRSNRRHGATSNLCRYDDETIASVRRMHAQGHSNREISNITGLRIAYVWALVTGRKRRPRNTPADGETSPAQKPGA